MMWALTRVSVSIHWQVSFYTGAPQRYGRSDQCDRGCGYNGENISTLKDMLKKDPDNAELQERLDAANKSYTLMNDKMQKLFESSMTKAQGHLDLANSALTATGNRGSRVELVSNRLAKQQTNFKTLSSEMRK